MKNRTLISACALVALAGTSAGAQVIDWAAPIDGNWNNASNWVGSNTPDTIGEDAILGLIGAYTVDLTNSFMIGSLSLTNPAATLEMNQSLTLTLSGGVLNNGFIFVNEPGSVFDSILRFDSDAMISGTGSIRLGAIGNTDDAQLIANGGFTVTNANGHTILGSGHLGGNIINNGSIIADDAIGAGLRIADTITQGVSGNTGANTGSLLLGNGSVISGGTMSSINGGEIRVNGQIATIGNTTLSGPLNIPGQGYTLALNNGLANNGNIAINSNQTVFNAHLRFDTNTAIDGTGTITMFADNVFDAQIYTDGVFTGTIGSGQTITGSGVIDGRDGGTIVNNGTINGNHAIDGKTPARMLEINGNIDGSGGGIFRSDDGILNLGSGLVLDGGTFDSSGVGIVDMINGGLATLSNVTNNGQMGIRGQGSTIALTGPMTNNGDIEINSNQAVFNAHLRFDTNTTIDGTGTITMFADNVFDAQIYTDGVFTGTIGSGQTITGSGVIDGRDGGTIVNNGTINGNDPANELQLDGTHIGTGMYRSDDGVLALRGNSSITGGTFDSSGTGIVDMTGSGTITLSNITNLGQMGIRGQGGIVALASPLTNNGTILINSNDNVFDAHIRFLAATEINGSGIINMELAGNFGDAQILNDQGFIGTIGSGQTITGSGLIVGEMNMNGTFDPSSDERRFDVDSINFSSTSGMIADIGGLLAGEFDRLTVGAAETINLDGTLTVNLDAGYVPVFGDTWDIIDGGTITGMFADENLPAAPLGQVYRVIYQSSQVYIILTCDADLTGDNVLDFFDVSIFLNYFSSEDVRGDLNNDGAFNFFDISLFLQVFNGGCAG